MMSRRSVWVGLTAVGAFLAGRAIAGGIPTGAGAMTYSGVLEDASGAPLTGTHNVLFSLWDSAQSGAGTSRCNVQNPTGGYDLGTTGRFTISLPDTCTAAVKSYPSLWVELTVDSTVLPRTKLGAVPYAVEASHALNADLATNAATAATANAAGGGLASQVVPAGAVMAFDLASCPAGWSTYSPAGGRTIIGVTAGGGGLSARTLGQTLGEESHSLTTAELPSHTHNIAVFTPTGTSFSNGAADLVAQGGNQVASAFGDTVTRATGGGAAHNNMQPSLVLLYCRKT